MARKSYPAGGSSVSDEDRKAYVPRVDKNPYYRTTDILNGAYKKNIKLEAGKFNSTDLKTIWVNFGESKFEPILACLAFGKDDAHAIYQLGCGHKWEGKVGHPTDGSKSGPCWECGAEQSYLGFEHEWQHIIFRSDIVARKVFCEQYAKMLVQQAPHVDVTELEQFLSLFINLLDDIRVNSLWERIYYGSAQNIWRRWTRLTEECGEEANTNIFFSYVFSVAFGVDTDPNGPWEPLRDVLWWGTSSVRYRGFGNMLCIARATLDRCMGYLLSKVPPKPQQQPAASESGDDAGGADAGAEKAEASTEAGEGQDGAGEQQPSPTDGAGTAEGSSAGAQAGDPSGAEGGVTPEQKSEALKSLMENAEPLDEKEKHPDPEPGQAADAAAKAAIARALSMGDKELDQLAQSFTDEPDPDMADAIEKLQNGMASKSKDSQLTGNARAKMLLIDVAPAGVRGSEVELNSEEKAAVSRLRSMFYRELGRRKAQRDTTGVSVDVQSLIQYRCDHQDPNVYEQQDNSKGFAYAVLSDMSGSMSSAFQEVCHAVEALKLALKFPFVSGSTWGFRGGENSSFAGEVWLYRYHKECTGYTGWTMAQSASTGARWKVPVACGGLTPMNPAINVVVNHLRTREASGMAKRLFLLTDGSPVSNKTSGQRMPDFLLRQFVAKEINAARRSGIQVYTIVVGANAIPDDQCKMMFGPQQFWRKVGRDGVGNALTALVLQNFTRYIKLR
jgi:hypothetical protein